EAADIITQAKCGMVSEAGASSSLALNAMKFAQMNVKDREEMGKNGYKYYQDYFSKEKAFSTLINLIKF
ncbi:MAG: hypothetical protein WBQ32_11980, partial [Ignavibacteriaceae bacterium]